MGMCSGITRTAGSNMVLASVGSRAVARVDFTEEADLLMEAGASMVEEATGAAEAMADDGQIIF
jgi:hypothetical protein